MMAVMEGTGLTRSTVDEMFETQSYMPADEETEIPYGLGMGLVRIEGDTGFWHWGDNRNFRCFFIGFRESKIGIVYLMNSFYGLSIAKPVVTLAISGDYPAIFSKYLKRYGHPGSPLLEFSHAYVESGYDAAVRKYTELRKLYMASEFFSESSLNLLGYHYLQRDDADNAIRIFELNVRAYPGAFNVYDSLGEAYMEKGDAGRAIEQYEKSLELNPNNANAVRMLERLKSSGAR